MKTACHQPPIERLLARLEGAKQEGKAYRARCPACGGVSRKLSISATVSGAVLLHCFGTCEPADVLEAVGLRLSDLFPDRLQSLCAVELS